MEEYEENSVRNDEDSVGTSDREACPTPSGFAEVGTQDLPSHDIDQQRACSLVPDSPISSRLDQSGDRVSPGETAVSLLDAELKRIAGGINGNESSGDYDAWRSEVGPDPAADVGAGDEFHGETPAADFEGSSEADAIISEVVGLMSRQRDQVWLLSAAIAKLSKVLSVEEMRKQLRERAGLSKSMVSKYKKLGCTPALMKDTNRPYLPPHLKTLYALATCGKDEVESSILIENGIARGLIRPDMKFGEVQMLQPEGREERQKPKPVEAAPDVREREYLSVLEVLDMPDGLEILTMLREKGILLVDIPSAQTETAA